VIYRGFPSKLYHQIPPWVEPGAPFHIRIRLDRTKEQRFLTDPTLGAVVLDSARFYEAKQRWHILLFLLMPDHIHAVLSFGRDERMFRIVGSWKHFHSQRNGVAWQEGFFDHRLRDDERGEQRWAKIEYIRRNPVAAERSPGESAAPPGDVTR
jgi:REP element-mobilizing transposase RayT